MPWRETCAMRERLKFVALVEAGEETMAELCRRFGISRKTGYKFMERFAAQGIAGLCERSHAPHQHPHAVCEEIEQRVVELRGEHPFWGPRLIIPRKTRARVPADTSPFAACMDANDTWSIDFKGWFRTGDGRRCEPLTARSCGAIARRRVGERQVRQDGSIKWAGAYYFISELLVGEPVGLEEQDGDVWSIQFGPVVLGKIREGKFYREGGGRRGRPALRSPMAPRGAPARGRD
jgi:transposase-like protein